jgi:hypothetical protein
MSELYQVFGQPHCEPCGNSVLATRHAEVKPGDVSKMVDPTICGWCSTDYGQQSLPLVAGVPACDPCEQRMRNWPYPLWVKLSFAALLVLALGSFAYNLRFFQAYVYTLRGGHAASFEEGRDLAIRAAALVPESRELQDRADLYVAIDLMQQDKPTEALPLLKRLRLRMPNDAKLAELLAQAEMGTAFDAHDYDKFLELARGRAQQAPADIRSKAAVASALACKYAETGEERYERDARLNLAELNDMPGADSPELADFLDRIHFRLDKREIINTAEFQRRFPNGYHGKSETP